jgi:hypothetical protein
VVVVVVLPRNLRPFRVDWRVEKEASRLFFPFGVSLFAMGPIALKTQANSLASQKNTRPADSLYRLRFN